MKKIIGLTYDSKEDWVPQPGDPVDLNAEFDPPHTIDDIQKALESKGHAVKRLGNIHSLIKHIDHLGVDIVFNIAEGYHGRNRESQVPILLEARNIPFVGSDGLTLGLTLDKIVAKKFFLAEGIPTPRFFEARLNDDLEKLNTIGFPLIVKTRYEGSSKGLTRDSKVHDSDALKKQVHIINTIYRQSALVEEFITGREFTVVVLGNEIPEAMPVVQYQFEKNPEHHDKFYTFEDIVNNAVEYICPAPISGTLKDRLQRLAVRAYQAVSCRDFGRVDFRVDENANPYVLEINPLPCLSRDDTFAYISRELGISYEEMIHRVLEHGLQRYGLNNGKVQKAAHEPQYDNQR